MNTKKEAALYRVKDALVHGDEPLCPDVLEGIKALVSTLSPCAFLPEDEFDHPPVVHTDPDEEYPESEPEVPRAVPLFKGGDIVKCVRDVEDSDLVLGRFGVVIARDDIGRIGCDWFEFDSGHGLSGWSRHSSGPSSGWGYWVAPEALDFITHIDGYDVALKGTPYPEYDD